MNIKCICKLLALSYVDNFDMSEDDDITILGFSLNHGLALVATYFDSGVPNVHVVSFDSDICFDLFENESDITMTIDVDVIPNPLTPDYDNSLKLFLLACGCDLHTVLLFGFSNVELYGSDFNHFHCSELLSELSSGIVL